MIEKRTRMGGYASPDWGTDQLIHSRSLDKIAAECYTPPELMEVAEKLRPSPDGVYALINALGAYEYWDVNCFIAGTLVETEHGEVPIEDVRVHTRVRTHTGRLRPVLQTMYRSGSMECLRLTIDGCAKPLTTTLEHPFYVLRDGRWVWVDAQDLRIGDTLRRHTSISGDDEWASAELTAIEAFKADVQVHNLEVEGDNSYVAGGVAVHNCNGDAFPEWSLKGTRTPDSVDQVIKREFAKRGAKWVSPKPGSYGHSTFVSNATVFRQHDNKDRANSIGDIVASAYNDKMKRVELIVFVKRDRDPQTVRELETGQPVPWSMGARLLSDTCSVCSNCARNRAEYCDHLATQMRQVLPDGRKVFAYNFHPLFFDMSRVMVPADKISWALRKVASVPGARAPAWSQGVDLPAVGDPLSDRIADLRSSTAYDRDRMRPLPDHVLQKLASVDDPVLLAAMSGILLTDQEVQCIQSAPVVKLASATAEWGATEALRDHRNTRSMFEPYFSKRASRVRLAPGTPTFVAAHARLDPPTLKKLATLVGAQQSHGGRQLATDDRGGPSPDLDSIWLPFAVAANT